MTGCQEGEPNDGLVLRIFRSSNNAVLKRDGSFATPDAATTDGRADAKKMKNSRQPVGTHHGRTEYGKTQPVSIAGGGLGLRYSAPSSGGDIEHSGRSLRISNYAGPHDGTQTCVEC